MRGKLKPRNGGGGPLGITGNGLGGTGGLFCGTNKPAVGFGGVVGRR